MAYRNIGVTKRVHGKVKRYKNLAAFNRECKKHSAVGNACTVTNKRFTRRGSCLVSVKSEYPGGNSAIYRRGGRPSGTWLLHFEDCGVMHRHLRGRVTSAGSHPDFAGTRRRR